jgi:energy-coupling factor transporter ATP-binding protein EcfA2
MHSLEITLQHPRHGSFPVVAEHRSSSALPARAEGQLLPTGAAADLDAFDTALLQLLDQPHDYGTLLGQALFRDQIRDRFMSACAAAGDAGLRVLLVVEAPALWPLRWERLCAPDGAGGWDFLALDQTTPFSRYLPSLSDRRFPAIGRRDLRALVLLAAPPEQNPFDLAPFDAEAMAAAIGDVLGEIPHHRLGPVSDAIGPASLDALARHLTQPRDRAGYTLLHIVAHGALRGDDGETLIHLLDDTDQVAPVTATELIRRLGRLGASRGLPHLCFLATCEGASPEAESALGGLAQRLVRELGLPAVVAMTARVGIDTASMLTGPFYRQLRACGEPDRALVAAGAELHGRTDILVPALFARLAERPLFSTGIDIDRPLTPAELTHGLARLNALLAERAPVLEADFEQQARHLRATLPADLDALAEPARGERTQAIDALDALSLEVLDLGFPALALNEPAPDRDPRCPFPGLKAFQTDERAFFFGRRPLIDALTERLRRDRFLAVLGPSGSGKSSLVLAGLVPALLGDGADPSGATQPSPTGPYRYLIPGADPQAALARQLQTPPPTHTDTLLVIDQLEELFTLCTDTDRRAAFIADFTKARATHPRLHLVLTMRADFWGDCAAYPQLKGPMQAHQELIAPMDTAELRAAMEQQAAATGLRFEADLSHRILAEVEGEPGAMPLLQHLLLQLWLRRHGRWLRSSEYQALGGIRQAIAHTADGVCDRLIADQIADASLLRALFIRLTRLDDPSATSSSPATSSQRRLVDDSERNRDTRQRVPLAELMSIDEQPERVRRVVQRLADARLLMTSSATAANRPDSAVDDTQVEVSHEALIRYWPRLRDWIGDDREAWRLLADLGHDARKWQAAGEPDRDLPRWGERLRRAEALFAQPRFRPTDTERRFVAAARALDERERNEKAEREAARIAALERAANEQRRKTRIAVVSATVIALMFAVAVLLGTQSERARRDATGQLASTHWKQAMAVRETQPLDALHWLALAARRFDEAKRPARRDNALLALKLINDQPLLHAILPHEGPVTGAEYSANGDRILSWSDDGTARLWDAATGAPVVPPMTHEARVYGARLSSDGSRILTWSRDNTARVWDADTGRPVTPPLGHDDPVRGAQFTADGSAVLTWSYDGTARLWDATTGAPMTPPLAHDSIVNGAGFDADAAAY